ncbi:MAG: ATP-dependent Clp protease ATP-binding subunit, partial [Bacteroidales bacterium]|nr:ATP-dependent Clp protease ATP-binding subunit [Bacteroidales bacterium]
MDFTQDLQSVLNYAKEEAARLGNRVVTGDHLFLGILRHEKNDAVYTLREMGCNLVNVKAELESIIGADEIITYSEVSSIAVAKEIEVIFNNIARELVEQHVSNPSLLYLLLAIIRDSGNMVVPILKRYGITYQSVRDYQSGVKNESSQPAAETAGAPATKKAEEAKPRNTDTPTLNKYGNDLTAAASAGRLDPVVCRDNEIERLIQILGRRKKNNPVLIGEPGVGKSAIVEGLAIRIAERNVPKLLLDKRIVTLDMGSIVAGTKFRGQFEERIRMIVDELKESENTIIFIDELHTLVGAGGQAGSLDAANLLKPSLSRG